MHVLNRTDVHYGKYAASLPVDFPEDCYLKPGDAKVHYSPPLGAEDVDANWAGALRMELPIERRPRYCSIRLWQAGSPVDPRAFGAEADRRLGVGTLEPRKRPALREGLSLCRGFITFSRGMVFTTCKC